jgi:ferric-dicitrate binding protein FerR (iron transport regulator)
MEKTELLLKYLNNEASGKEIQEIYQWVNASEKNKQLFADLKNSEALLSSKLAPDSSMADFESLNKKIATNKKGIFSLRRFYRIAAAILFPVMLAVSAGLVYTNYVKLPDPVYTEVVAPPKHNSQVVLSDGTQVWLSPESKLIYSQNYGKKNRRVKLFGEGYFEVSHDEQKTFTVETYGLNVEVLGTSFNIEAYPEDEIIRTTLVRGSVKLVSGKFQNDVFLSPGDRLSYDVAQDEASLEKVNTEIYRLVKDGLLIFKRNNLNEVCRKLERWFMIPIEYDGIGNQNLLFTAKFEDESIEQILEIVSETIPINYQIRKNEIIIKYRE